MIRALIPIVLALIALPAPAWAQPQTGTIRALFVGIDHYLYSSARVPDAEFRDLRGAVGDTRRFKAALAASYGLAVDQPREGVCASRNAVSVTLTDECATRAAMLAALDELIGRSAAGDTLLFYFAGHGSTLTDDVAFDQASGAFDTILPADARKPGEEARGDILDRELRQIVDRATAKGVNVVSVFDSCNSATATRTTRKTAATSTPPPDLGEPRYARGIVVAGLVPAELPPARGPGGGYRVHLGAAQDNQQAREAPAVRGGEDRQGLFTTALIAAMAAAPRATFGDLILSVSRQVNDYTRGKQTPQGEGALNAALGMPDRPVPLFEVRLSADDRPELTAGRLSGVTEGSRFALYHSYADALAGGPPLANAVAGKPDAFGAPLAVAGLPLAPFDHLVARETLHVWGPGLVPLVNDATGPANLRIDGVIHASPLVALPRAAPRAMRYTVIDRPGGTYAIAGRGVTLPLGGADAGLEERVGEAIRKIAAAESLLALANAPAGSQTCVAPGTLDDLACPPLAAGPVRQVPVGAPLTMLAANINPQRAARYLYVLVIDETFAIKRILPAGGGVDGQVEFERPQRRRLELSTPGLYRFVTIASAARINPAALEQSGIGARDTGGLNPNEWTASVTEIMATAGG